MTIIQKKVCLLGDLAVGKTSLVRRFVEGRFDDKYLSTLGVTISRKSLTRPTGNLNLLVWDLAGRDDANKQSTYLQGAAGGLIVCDLTRRDTLAVLEHYANLMRVVNPATRLVFVANKLDLEAERTIPDADLESTCARLGGPYVIASAKTGAQVDQAFLLLAELLERPL